MNNIGIINITNLKIWAAQLFYTILPTIFLSKLLVDFVIQIPQFVFSQTS